jgi:hypothetical protein
LDLRGEGDLPFVILEGSNPLAGGIVPALLNLQPMVVDPTTMGKMIRTKAAGLTSMSSDGALGRMFTLLRLQVRRSGTGRLVRSSWGLDADRS